MNLTLRYRVFGHGKDSSFLRAAARLAAFSLVALPLGLFANPQTQQSPAVAGSNNPGSNNAIPSDAPQAAVQHVKLLLEKGNPALEIETTLPVTPQINKSNEGMRLVIDLPNTNMSVADKIVPIKNRDLSEMRLNLLATWPPKVHVEVDFRTKLGYTWESTGNRILITFHEPGKNEPSEDSAAAASTGGASSPLPVSTGADAVDFAHMVLAERLAAGASVTAGSETTVLRLKHAGDVYVCPQTSVSVVHSKNGPDLMLAMNDGGLETHIVLKDAADEVVTPDFRILLRGPGEFDYAIRSDSRGNTCVRTLPGNTASAIIYELLGDGTYNVQAKDQLVFHEGKLSPEAASDANSGQGVMALECGCPPPERSSLLATVTPAPPLAVENTSASTSTGSAHTEAGPPSTKDSTPSGSPAAPESAAEIRDLPQSLKQQPHLAVEASLTFTPNPGRIAASHLPAASASRQVSSPVNVLPPTPPAPEHKTMFGKIKNFFSRVF
jgi:hypothetical protein